MAEPIDTRKRPVNPPKVHVETPGSRAQSLKESRPYYLDWVLQHQIEIASSLFLGVVALHTFHPPSRPFTRKFLQLSYRSETNQTYKQGPDDFYFVLAWVVNFTALRAISIDWILQPVAQYAGVIQKTQLRFAEQGWLIMYYSTFWSLGMYLWYNSVYWLNNNEIWTSWPEREMSGVFKWYYLVQLAFWFQQILVIHIEKRRKDHAQMLTHHLITCTLISITCVYRYFRAGNVVLCLMDVVDLLFPIAKMLKYLRYQTACNIAFGIFVATWFIARHVLYLRLCYDIYMDVPGPSTMFYGCYNAGTYELRPDLPAHPDYFSHLLWPFQDPEGIICLNVEVKWIFLGMLGLLQALSLIWFGMIIKVIIGMLTGGSAEDTRSDDEEEADADREEESQRRRRPMTVTDLNVCVGGSEAGETSRGVTRSPKPKPIGSRRRLMDVEHKKELLGRIGCEKP